VDASTWRRRCLVANAVTSSGSSAPPDASELASEASEAPSEPDGPQIDDLEVRSMDGSGNNEAHPNWGAAGQPYRRLAPANDAEGGGPVDLAGSSDVRHNCWPSWTSPNGPAWSRAGCRAASASASRSDAR
jgi:hypothetical protein